MPGISFCENVGKIARRANGWRKIHIAGNATTIVQNVLEHG
eukprot:gene4375-255_t